MLQCINSAYRRRIIHRADSELILALMYVSSKMILLKVESMFTGVIEYHILCFHMFPTAPPTNGSPIILLISLEFYMFRLLDKAIINICCTASDSCANTDCTC